MMTDNAVRRRNGSKPHNTGTKTGVRGNTHRPMAKSEPKQAQPIAYIDTEFNAFDHYGQNGGCQEIIEIGIVIMRGGEFIDGFRSYCALSRGHILTKRASELTGIKKSDIVNAPPFPEVLQMMNVFLDMHNPYRIYAYGGEDRQ